MCKIAYQNEKKKYEFTYIKNIIPNYLNIFSEFSSKLF
jgi:hypothetical protein